MARKRTAIDTVDVLEVYRGKAIRSTADDGTTEIFYDDYVAILPPEHTADETDGVTGDEAASQESDTRGCPGDVPDDQDHASDRK